jgi:hypothetical protein
LKAVVGAAGDHGPFRERPHELHEVVGVGEGEAEPVRTVVDHDLPFADLARCALKEELR